MARLLLGPLLRYVDATRATLWVEADAPCEVEVLGHRSPTFCVGGRHYGLVVVEGLEPDRSYSYEVALDGEGLGTVWGTQKAKELLSEAGFKQIDVKSVEGDIFNAYYIARK